MSETQAASSPAEVDVFEGRTEIGVGEYIRSRQPAENKPADNATTALADAQKQTASEGDKPESSGEPDTPTDSQEKSQPKKLNADGRAAQIDRLIEAELEKPDPDPDKIANLQKTRDRVLGGAEAKRKTEFATVTPPQAQPPQPQSMPMHTRPEPTGEERNPDGTLMYSDWDDLNRARIAWGVEQGIAQFQRQQFAQAKAKEFEARAIADRERFGDEYDALIAPTLNQIRTSQIPDLIKERVLDSDMSADIARKFATDTVARDKFIRLLQTDPVSALEYIGELKVVLKQSATPARGEDGQFIASESPAQKKTTAPKPPSPVSGGSSRAFDVSDESLSSEEWMRKRNKQLGKG